MESVVSLEQLHDVYPIVHQPLFAVWWVQALFWSIVSGSGILIIFGVIYWWRSRKEKAAVVAMKKMLQLELQYGARELKTSELYLGLTAILKEYCQTQYGISVRGKTDSEFRLELSQLGIVLPDDLLEKLLELLLVAGEAKFAEKNMDAVVDDHLVTVRSFIVATSVREQSN